MIKIYNSLSRKKEEFIPIEAESVRMYACGITPYDEAHVGHAMQAIIFDTIRRYLEFKNYKVTYVRNFTDIDDKIIDKARKLGVSALELSSKYIESSKKDLTDLKVRPATHEPLVSENIKHIIDFIQKLIEKKHAYVANSDVYFDVSSFKEYGKLSGRSTDELISDSDNETSVKKSPLDFALWKSAKEGEVFWESPWGKGRPGWHIECSVLANIFLGSEIDIHGGGLDIIFPHHENEVAQSEAYTGKQFARYWMHNGLLMVGKQKMSKSLGNFYTIKDALKKYEADVIRFMILSFSYSSNVNFNEDNLLISEKRTYYYYSTLQKIQILLNDEQVKEEQSNDAMINKAKEYNEKLIQAMDDNFNSAQALAYLNELFTEVNNYLSRKKQISKKGLKQIIEAIKNYQELFSVLTENVDTFFVDYKKRIASRLNMEIFEIEKLIENRNLARKQKQYEEADKIRKELLEKGIVIMDMPDGSTDWNI